MVVVRSPEAVLETAEMTRALERAVDALPAGMRAVLVLRDVEGLSAAETCHVLGISEVNQRVSLHRARVKLQSVLVSILQEGA
jgi:RNA polymerase sigma-70 factor (ECF subfamily)